MELALYRKKGVNYVEKLLLRQNQLIHYSEAWLIGLRVFFLVVAALAEKADKSGLLINHITNKQLNDSGKKK